MVTFNGKFIFGKPFLQQGEEFLLEFLPSSGTLDDIEHNFVVQSIEFFHHRVDVPDAIVQFIDFQRTPNSVASFPIVPTSLHFQQFVQWDQ
jgi:hypothetical protein